MFVSFVEYMFFISIRIYQRFFFRNFTYCNKHKVIAEGRPFGTATVNLKKSFKHAYMEQSTSILDRKTAEF